MLLVKYATKTKAVSDREERLLQCPPDPGLPQDPGMWSRGTGVDAMSTMRSGHVGSSSAQTGSSAEKGQSLNQPKNKDSGFLVPELARQSSGLPDRHPRSLIREPATGQAENLWSGDPELGGGDKPSSSQVAQTGF